MERVLGDAQASYRAPGGFHRCDQPNRVAESDVYGTALMVHKTLEIKWVHKSMRRSGR